GNTGPANAGDRRNIDDRPAAFHHHQRDDVLHGEECALQVHGDHAVPFLLRQLDHATDLGDADIVVENVDAAEIRNARPHHRLDVVVLGDVGAERQGEATLPRNDVRGFLGGREIDI